MTLEKRRTRKRRKRRPRTRNRNRPKRRTCWKKRRIPGMLRLKAEPAAEENSGRIRNMATIIDGKAISAAVRADVAAEVAALKEKGIVPCLA